MTDLTLLSPSPSPLYGQSGSPFSPTQRSPVSPFTSGPRFASKSFLDVSSPRNGLLSPTSNVLPIGRARASTSQLRLDMTRTLHTVPENPESPRLKRSRTISTLPAERRPSPLKNEIRRKSTDDSQSSPRRATAQEQALVNGHDHRPQPLPDDDYFRNEGEDGDEDKPPDGYFYSADIVSPVPTVSLSPTSYLSPPKNRHGHRQPHSVSHSPQRSLSAPPERTEFAEEEYESVYSDEFGGWKKRPPNSAGFAPRRAATVYGPGRRNSSPYAPSERDPRELLPPPPPLLRPTTFWRHTPRSGVSGASYSPSSHLVRRSTFVAAGLLYERPGHDLSALCVESRAGRNKVSVKPGDQLFINVTGEIIPGP